MVARLVPEAFPDMHFGGPQVVQPDQQRLLLVPGAWRGPASPRPPGVPAMPRPGML
jgi:hypothetical protein